MLKKNKKIGNLGEKIAKKHFQNKGFTFIESNFSRSFGEIDLIMLKNNIYYFIEVKSSEKINTIFLPEERFNLKKMNKFTKIVNFYVDNNDILEFKMILVGVYFNIKTKKAKIKIIDSIY